MAGFGLEAAVLGGVADYVLDANRWNEQSNPIGRSAADPDLSGPDRIVVYLWSKAGGTNFNFKFRPRYAINAQTPASVVYDYYNPDARATVAPLKFAVNNRSEGRD